MNENSTASTLRRHEKYDRLIAAAKKLKPIATAVAHPCDETSLKGAVEAGEAGLIKPILVGPKAKIEAVAKEHSLDLGGIDVVDVPHSQAAAEKAVELVRTGKADLLNVLFDTPLARVCLILSFNILSLSPLSHISLISSLISYLFLFALCA